MKKELKQSFTSVKGNFIEIVETNITGRGINEVRHYVKVNGLHDEKAYSTNQLIEIMK